MLIWSESVGLCGASWRNWFSTSRTTACHAQGTLCKCNFRAEFMMGRTPMEKTFAYFGFRKIMPPVPNLMFSTRLATSDVEQSTKSYRSIVYREAEVEEEEQQRKPEKLVHAVQQLQADKQSWAGWREVQIYPVGELSLGHF